MIKIDETQRVEDWELLAQCSQSYHALSDAFMDQIKMHRTQAMVLYRLFVQEGMIQSEIAQQLSVQGATITDILQRMEEAGLVSRRRDPEDKAVIERAVNGTDTVISLLGPRPGEDSKSKPLT